jgi:cytochrome c5
MKKFTVLFVLGIGLVGCTAKKVVAETAVEAVVDMSNFTPEQIEGKFIYEGKCGKCHDLPNNNEYTKEKWHPIMVSMQKKAKISDDERELVYSYVTMNL